MTEPVPQTSSPQPKPRRRFTVGMLLRIALLMGLVAAGIAWGIHGPVRADSLRAAIENSPSAPLVYILVQIVASLLFIPRTVVGVAGGMMFGMGWGILWTSIGSLAGSVIGFLVARYINGGLIDLASNRHVGPMMAKVERGGWRSVAVLRLVPVIPNSLSNYALGLTRLSLGSYLTGSLLGQLPMTVASVDLGAAASSAVAGKPGWIVPTLIGGAALIISLLLPRLIAKRTQPDVKSGA